MTKSHLKKFIEPQLKKAKELGLDFILGIEISPLKQKKYRVYLNDGTYIDYGHILYDDYLQHKDPERRKKFFARWSKNPNINNPHSPVFYITRLTW